LAQFVDIPASARKLASRLAALPEATMRSVALAEWIRASDPAETTEVLVVIVRRGRSAGPPFQLALHAFVAVLGGDGVPYALRRHLYALAKRRGHDDLARLFLSALASADTPAEVGRTLAMHGRPLTLGERKQLARGGRRDLLDRLLRDPEPQVIRTLLGNPRLTERDVIVIAARRPTLAELQREVFAARRWVARYRVKRALVLNPYTPTDLAIRLLPFLREPDRQLVASDAELPVALREAARELGRAHGSARDSS
jgi:hypothetical protein